MRLKISHSRGDNQTIWRKNIDSSHESPWKKKSNNKYGETKDDYITIVGEVK